MVTKKTPFIAESDDIAAFRVLVNELYDSGKISMEERTAFINSMEKDASDNILRSQKYKEMADAAINSLRKVAMDNLKHDEIKPSHDCTDHEAHARFAQLSPTANHQQGEAAMNTEEIIAQIEKTREVMSAQLHKLNERCPRPFPAPTVREGETGLEELLHATVAGHIANAAEALRTLGEAEAATRAVHANKTAATEPGAAPSDPQVIDTEFKEMPS